MNKKFLKAVQLGVCATLLTTVFAGCGSTKNEEASNGGEQPTEKIQLRYATGDSGPAVTLQEEIVKAFNEQQDKIEIKLETYGSAFDQKLAASIGANNAPDVVKMWNFPAYYESLLPLNDKIDSLEDKDDFYGALFNYANMNGDIYGMPIGFSTRALHYNKTLLEEANIKVEDDWTMDDLREAAKTLTDKDITGMYFYYNPDPYAIESFLWSNGGEWIDDNGNPVVNSDANKEALKAIHDMIYKDKIAFAGNLGDDFGQVMGSGKYGFGEMGKWFIPAINDAGIDLGIAPMPGFQEGKSMSVVHAAFLSLTNSSEHPEEAWEFVKFYTSYDSVKKLSEIEMPVRQAVASELGYLNDEQISPFYTMLERSEAKRPTFVKTVKWPEVSSELATGLEAIFAQENADIDKILDEVQSKVESVMQ